MEIRLDGRVALITGGSKGLGLAMATVFAKAGADVAILARRADALEEARAAIGGSGATSRIAGFSCDVADAGAIMPPKSTWFEPKLADGAVSHVLD